eukprot:3968593-Amphidinium_carterae.1
MEALASYSSTVVQTLMAKRQRCIEPLVVPPTTYLHTRRDASKSLYSFRKCFPAYPACFLKKLSTSQISSCSKGKRGTSWRFWICEFFSACMNTSAGFHVLN